jgi:UDP-glucose 4-epimerase
MNDSRVLITGASGFLGSHLSAQLASTGACVHAVSRTSRNHPSNYRWWTGDLSDVAFTRSLCKEVQPEVIFHFAGLSSAVANLDLVLPTYHSLLTSTLNILNASQELGNCRRLVLIASLTEPMTTDSNPIASSPYAAAKWACGAYGRMFNKLFQTPIVFVRPFMTYGPRQQAGKLIPYVITSLLGKEPPKLSSGSWKADWVHVDDVVDGLVAASRVPNIEGNTFDLGSGVLVSIREVVGQLVEIIGSQIQPLFGAVPDRPMEPVRSADLAASFQRLGWQPKVSLKVGLERTVDWHKRSLVEAQARLRS